MLKNGLELELSKIVLVSDTAVVVGSGMLDVFSTPMMIAFMENTAFNCVQKFLAAEDTTVGIEINTKHLKANLVGDEITSKAVLKKIDNKKLFFDIEVKHGEEVVGISNHY